MCESLSSPGLSTSGFTWTGCGLSGRPECLIIIDCCDLNSDLARRLSAGETLSEMMSELHYGIMAEVEGFARELLNTLQTTIGETMINTDQNGQIGRASRRERI